MCTHTHTHTGTFSQQGQPGTAGQFGLIGPSGAKGDRGSNGYSGRTGQRGIRVSETSIYLHPCHLPVYSREEKGKQDKMVLMALL